MPWEGDANNGEADKREEGEDPIRIDGWVWHLLAFCCAGIGVKECLNRSLIAEEDLLSTKEGRVGILFHLQSSFKNKHSYFACHTQLHHYMLFDPSLVSIRVFTCLW